jgi:hypothetical protein
VTYAIARRGANVAPAILFAALASCGGGVADPGPGGGTPGLRIVSGAPVTDTISSAVAQPLAVEVMDATGRPAAGRFVVFEVVPNPPPPSVIVYEALTVAREGDTQLRSQILDTTDSRGRAAVRVRLGTAAGAGAVRINVPELGFVDTARYTTLTGALFRVDASPADSAAYAGQGYVVRALATDRAGNLRPNDPITFSVASGPVTIDATTGAMTATAIGRASIVASSGTKSSSVSVSVVPRGWVAAQQHFRENGGPIGVFLMQLDGSGRTPLAGPIANVYASDQGFGWSPDGSELAIARGDSVDLVTPGAPERLLVRAGGPVVLGARFSRDGGWIYFARTREGLSRVRRDGTGLQPIGRGNGEFGQDYRPSPSPDGRSVAYASSRTPCGVDACIRVLDLATDADRSYGGRGYLVRGTNAAWSPTDDLIGYASPTEVGVIRSDGTGQRVFATDVRLVGWIEWSPDGKWLIVSPATGPVLLFDVQSGARLPVSSLGNYGATAWRP